MLNRQVYVVDYEMVSPIAVGVSNCIESIRSDFSAEQYISDAKMGNVPFKKAAYIKDSLTGFCSDEPEKTKEAFRYNRKLELLAACYGIGKERFDKLASILEPEKTGVILGVGADFVLIEEFREEIFEHVREEREPLKELLSNPELTGSRVNPVSNPLDLFSLYLASKFNAAAFQKTVLTACVSSTQAIAFGYDAIKSGQVDACIVGGTDSLVNQLAIISFGKIGIISKTTDEKSCKPFDLKRTGTLVGEAAGIAVLVSEDFLVKNRLHAKAELMGYGNTLDGYKITAPDPKGDRIVKSIEEAVFNAGIEPEDIDYINAHGTGTQHNDELELNCIKRALGDAGYSIPVSSTKDRHGHAIAAAGIQEFCVLLELMKYKTIPANLNLEKPCDLKMNLVRENRTDSINVALSNNFAFGGVNTVLAIKNEAL